MSISRTYFLWSAFARTYRLQSFVHELAFYSRNHSSLVPTEGPSARALREPYPEITLDSSIFEDCIFTSGSQDSEDDHIIQTSGSLLKDAVLRREFALAQQLLIELIDAGVPVGRDYVYVKALKHAVEARSATADKMSALLLWLPLVPHPEKSTTSSTDPRTTRMILDWVLSHLITSDPNAIDSLTRVSLAVTKAGYGLVVAGRVLPYIIRHTHTSYSNMFFTKFLQASNVWFEKSGKTKDYAARALEKSYGIVIKHYASAGFLEESVNTAKAAYNSNATPPSAVMRKLETRLKEAGRSSLLAILEDLRHTSTGRNPHIIQAEEARILHLQKAGNLKAAVRLLFQNDRKGVIFSPHVLNGLKQDLLAPGTPRQWHNRVHAIARARSKSKKSSSETHAHNKILVSKTDVRQTNGIVPLPFNRSIVYRYREPGDLHARLPSKSLNMHRSETQGRPAISLSVNDMARVLRFLRAGFFHDRAKMKEISAQYLASFMDACSRTARQLLLQRLYRKTFRRASVHPKLLWATAEMLLQQRRQHPYGVVLAFQTYFTHLGVPAHTVASFCLLPPESSNTGYLNRTSLYPGSGRKPFISGQDSPFTKFLPSGSHLAMVWAAMVQLSLNHPTYPLLQLYEAFLSEVRARNTKREGDGGPRVTLPPVAQFDPSHFTEFLRAFGTRHNPGRALRVISDMRALGIEPNIYTWTILASTYARAKRVEEANQILLQLHSSKMKGKENISGFPPATPATYASIIRGHMRAMSLWAARRVELQLFESGYRPGDNVQVDAILQRLRSKERYERLATRRRYAKGRDISWVVRYRAALNFRPLRRKLRRYRPQRPQSGMK